MIKIPVASARASTVNPARQGFRSTFLIAIRIDALNHPPIPARSTNDGRNDAGASGRIASAGGNNTARPDDNPDQSCQPFFGGAIRTW